MTAMTKMKSVGVVSEANRKAKKGDYIWHRGGPVGYGIVTAGYDSGSLGYTLLRAIPAHLAGFYVCSDPAEHMRVVAEEDVLRILLSGADAEIEEIKFN